MAFTSPRPSAAMREAFHSPRYRNRLVDDGIIAATHRVPDAKTAVFDLEHQIPHLPDYALGLELLREIADRGRLLDVGCSSGLFVHVARLAGFDALGVDIQPEVVAQGRELFDVPLVVGRICTGFQPKASFDVITMWDVLEHVPDPIADLAACRHLLRPNGVLLVKSPNNALRLALLRAGLRRPQRGEYPMISFEHIQHWTPGTLRHALLRVGFDRVEVADPTVTRRGTGARDLANRIVFWASRRRWSLVHPMLLIARAPQE